MHEKMCVNVKQQHLHTQKFAKQPSLKSIR